MRQLLAVVLSMLVLAALSDLRAAPAQVDPQPPAAAPAPAPAAPQAPPWKAKSQQPPLGEWLDPIHDAPNGTQYKTFASKVLGRDVSYLLYLPPGYEQEKKRYPVIYWLHGRGGNQRAGAMVYIPHMEAAVKAIALPPAIVVMVNGMGRGHYLDMPNGQLPIESVIIKDLVPHIDQTYRTIAKREGRIIEGFSMGGFGAAHLGFKYPELFGTVVVNSGALRDADWFPAEEHPKQLARKNADKLRGQTHIHIGCGSLDDLLPANQQLHEVLDELHIENLYEVVPDVPHDPRKYYDKVGTKFFEFHRKILEALAKGE